MNVSAMHMPYGERLPHSVWERGARLCRSLRKERKGLDASRGRDLRPLWRGRAFLASAGEPMAIRRARAFRAVLDAMALVVRPNELIVGAPRGVLAPTLPQGVTEEALAACVRGDRAIGERGFATGFDHLAPDYAHLLDVGLGGLLAEVRASREGRREPSRIAFLDAVRIALEGMGCWIARWAVACRHASSEASPERAAELADMAADLEAVRSAPPASFAQAVQLVWLVHVALAIEGRGAMALGRLDQYLWPFYRDAVHRGGSERAAEVLGCLWAKLEEPLLPNPVTNIAIGGLTSEGEDAVNDLSYVLLQVTGAIGTPHSNLSARWSRRTPTVFRDACIELIKTGIGFPALFNDDVLVPAIERMGVPIDAARDYAFVGCIETHLPGRMPPWSDSRVNLCRALELALHAGRVPGSDRQIGLDTGDPRDAPTFDAFSNSYLEQLGYLVRQHCAATRAIREAVDAQTHTSPFLSALVADCIARGRDVNDGGARYPAWHGPCGVGLGTVVDALAAIRLAIYEEGWLGWDELLDALAANWREREALRLRLVRLPKYGNGVREVDELAAVVARAFGDAVLVERLPRGGRFVPLMAANVANIAAGRELGATPDGRRAGEPVSDAASPTFGRDHRGPTGVVESLTRVDYAPMVGGTVVNMRFGPRTIDGSVGTAALRDLVCSYFARGGMQIQFNVTGAERLREAMASPGDYADLVVRVSGFSALFVGLDPAVQQDILARTEH